MLPPAHRRIQRGVTLIECLVLLGMMLIVAAAGVRLAGKRIDALAARQADCIATWSGEGCSPSGGESSGPGDRASAPGAARKSGAGDAGEASSGWSHGDLLASAGLGGVHAKRTAPMALVSTDPVEAVSPEPSDGPICFQVGSGGQAVQVSGTPAGQSTSIKVGQSAVTAGADGRTMVTITLTLSAKDAHQLEKDIGRYGFSIDGYTGGYVTVSITVPVSGGTACLPDIHDPRSWPVGTSLRVEIGDTTGYGASVSVNGVTIGTSHSESEGVALVVTRADEDHLLVAVGDTEVVGNALSLGIGKGPVEIGVTSSDEWRSDDFRVAEVNLDDGSVRLGTMYTEKVGGSLTGYVQLDAGVTIRYEWTMNGQGTSVSTTRFADEETSVLTEWTQDGGTATYTIDGGVPGDVVGVWLARGDEVLLLRDAPQCLDPGGRYVVRWTLTPADRAAFEAQVRVWWEGIDGGGGNGDHGPHMNDIAKTVPQYPDIDAPFDADGLTRVLSTSYVSEIADLQLHWQQAGVAFPGTVEVLDPSTGQPVTC
jgi:hypothetical protein